MAKRTYPARKSRIAKGFDFRGCDSHNPSNCSCETWTPVTCPECGEDIEDGQRIVDTTRWDQQTEDLVGEIRHAACASENHE